MSLCKKYYCEKCEAYKDCGGCEKCNGCPFGKPCVLATIIKENGLDYSKQVEKIIIEEVNNLNIPELHIDSLNVLPGAYVNLEYKTDNGVVKFLDDKKTYFANQVERKNNDRCYGIVSNGKFIIVAEYGENGSEPKLIIYKSIYK